MTKQENGLKMLRKLLEGVKTLEDSQFNYSSYISRADSEGCGTVCCFIGWSPRFIPEIGYEWFGAGVCLRDINSDAAVTSFKITEDFGLPLNEILFMFYANLNPHDENHDYDRFGDGYDANLEQVINRVEYILERYDK